MSASHIFSNEKPIFYINTGYFLAILNVMTSLFSIFLVLKKLSPTAYKYNLLLYMVTLSSVELFACLCLSPKPLFPVIGAKVWSPVINHFGLDIHLGADILFVFGELILPTIGLCFIYRHDAAAKLIKGKTVGKLGTLIFILVTLLFSFVSCFLIRESKLTLSEMQEAIQKYYPQAVNMTLENVYFYEYRINDTILYTILLVYFFESIGGLFLFILSIRTIKILNNVTGTLSRRIVTLQRDVLHSLMAQTLAPLIFICVPVVFCSYVVLLQNFDLDAIVLVSMGMMMVHGTASNIAMIATTPRFREFIKNILWAGVNREPNRVQILGVP